MRNLCVDFDERPLDSTSNHRDFNVHTIAHHSHKYMVLCAVVLFSVFCSQVFQLQRVIIGSSISSYRCVNKMLKSLNIEWNGIVQLKLYASARSERSTQRSQWIALNHNYGYKRIRQRRNVVAVSLSILRSCAREYLCVSIYMYIVYVLYCVQ